MITRSSPLLKFVYGLAAAVALFTGFGNMPLWKRYYVADIPGMAWSGDFFINVNVHIVAGSLLLAIGIYAVSMRLVTRGRYRYRLTLSGKVRGLLLALTLATGGLMVIKNLPGINFPLAALIVFNFSHMAAALLFMLATLAALMLRQPWRQAG